MKSFTVSYYRTGTMHHVTVQALHSTDAIRLVRSTYALEAAAIHSVIRAEQGAVTG